MSKEIDYLQQEYCHPGELRIELQTGPGHIVESSAVRTSRKPCEKVKGNERRWPRVAGLRNRRTTYLNRACGCAGASKLSLEGSAWRSNSLSSVFFNPLPSSTFPDVSYMIAVGHLGLQLPRHVRRLRRSLK